MTKILITGAGGFVGSHLTRALQKSGETTIFANVFKSSSEVASLLPSDQILSGDLTDAAYTLSLIQSVQPDVIYHLAALSVVHNSVALASQVMTSNTLLQYNLLEAIRLHAPQARLIAICSANQYGQVEAKNLPINENVPFRPLNPYAVSKITQEMLALQYYLSHNLDIVILRPFNHTGIGQTTDFVIPALIKQVVEIEKGQRTEIEVGTLGTQRDFTDVEDMVSAYILASKKGVAGESYNIGTGKAYSVKDILDLLQTMTEKPLVTKEKPELMRESDVPVLIADATKFKTLTGWEPIITLSQTLERILNYWRTL